MIHFLVFLENLAKNHLFKAFETLLLLRPDPQICINFCTKIPRLASIQGP